jgi:hypothetical protein
VPGATFAALASATAKRKYAPEDFITPAFAKDAPIEDPASPDLILIKTS